MRSKSEAEKTRLDTGERRGYRTEDVDIFGKNEAEILSQLHFLLNSQSVRSVKENKVDGEWWVTKTFREWQLVFYWWDQKTVERCFRRLIKFGVVKTRDGYKLINPKESRNTKVVRSYTIDYARHEELCKQHEGELNGTVPPVEVIAPREEVINSRENNVTNAESKGQNVLTIEGQNAPAIYQDKMSQPYSGTNLPAERSVPKTNAKTTDKNKEKEKGAERLNAAARVSSSFQCDSDSAFVEVAESIIKKCGIQKEAVKQYAIKLAERLSCLELGGLPLSQHLEFQVTDPVPLGEFGKVGLGLTDDQIEEVNEYKRTISQLETSNGFTIGEVPF